MSRYRNRAPLLRRSGAKHRGRQGIQLPGGSIVTVPANTTAEAFARQLGVQLKPRPRDRRPLPGLPRPEELNMAVTEEGHEIVAASAQGGAGAAGTVSAAIAQATEQRRSTPQSRAAQRNGAAVAATNGWIPLREAAKRTKIPLIGQVKIVSRDGGPHVWEPDLEALENKHRRAAKVAQSRNGGGAAETASRAILNARQRRRAAYAARIEARSRIK